MIEFNIGDTIFWRFKTDNYKSLNRNIVLKITDTVVHIITSLDTETLVLDEIIVYDVEKFKELY